MRIDRSRLLFAALLAAAALALPATASATVYCSGGYNQDRPCDTSLPTFQAALDAASVHPGADTVRLGFGDFSSAGFVYSDRGSAANGVAIEGTNYCEPHSNCGKSTLKGAGAGAAQLSFTGGGGAPVTVSDLYIDVNSAATGLALPAGGRGTNLYVNGLQDGATGVRLAGAGATLAGGSVLMRVGGATDVAVDATAPAVVDRTNIAADLGIRSEGPGLLEVRGGLFNSVIGIRANHARIAGAILDAAHGPGVEAVCPSTASADSEVSVTNATLVGDGSAGSLGVRAVAAGPCAADLDVNSSTITGVSTSVLAHGDATGAAHVGLRYSNFDPAKVVTEGPATVDSAVPGSNLNADPGFILLGPASVPRYVGSLDVTLKWTSALIDHGDPGPVEAWQSDVVHVTHGRRDIGADEYRFSTPIAFPGASPARVGPGAPVHFNQNTLDLDIQDLLTTTLRFDDGETVIRHGLTPTDDYVDHTFEQLGRLGATLTVEDPTHQKWTGHIDVNVVRPRVKSLGFSRARFRRGRRVHVSCDLSVPARVVFTIQRRVHRHRRSIWKRVPGKRTMIAAPSPYDVLREPEGWARFRVSAKWGQRRLRPGLFRVTATPAKGKAAHARFRILP